MSYSVNTERLSVEAVRSIVSSQKIELSAEAIEKIDKCRKYLDKKVEETEVPIYGVNTGFGSLYDRNIPISELEKLQENLVKSHACGMGNEIDPEIVRIMIFLKIKALTYGNSGVQVSTVQRLVDFLNLGITPIIYEFGSLGASGDLAPLAHLCLPMLGLGEVEFNGKRLNGGELNSQCDWQPLKLQAKEGLALLNGTQFMSAFGVYCLHHSWRLMKLANLIGALSLDAFDGRIEPFHPLVHQIRPQIGQAVVAKSVTTYLEGSEMIGREKAHVQDPYSFRCIPQVHGASHDTITYVESVFLNEINGVTDNPNVFPDEDLIISAGNFHGQPLALAFDFLAIGLAELGNISERRTYQLITGGRELPYYLVANPGINSGLMIPQYTAASIVSKNKTLCTPSSVDSIVSSGGQEDHVSMGANGATKAYTVVNNLYSLMAIELLSAVQAFEFRRPAKSSEMLEKLMSNFRTVVPFIENDRVLHDDLAKAENFLKNIDLDNY